MKKFALLVLGLILLANANDDHLDQLPGIDKCALGYIVTDDTFGRSAVKITWDQNYKIRSPYDKQVYRVPDQIDPKGLKTAHTFAKFENVVVNKTEDWERFDGGQKGIKITIPKYFEFSRSKIHKKLRAHLNHTSHIFGRAGEYHSYFQVRLMPPELLEVSDELQRMFKLTGGSFNSTTQRTWFNIFSYYGTHYMPYFVLGGKVTLTSYVDTTYMKNTNIDYVRKQIGFKFGADTLPDSADPATEYSPLDPAIGVGNDEIIPIGDNPQPLPESESDDLESTAYPPGVDWGFSFSKVKEQYNKLITEDFNQISNTTIDLFGGDGQHVLPENWREWVPTIIEIPEVIEMKARPIHELLLHDPRLAAAWKQAEAAYKKWWVETKQYEKDDGFD